MAKVIKTEQVIQKNFFDEPSKSGEDFTTVLKGINNELKKTASLSKKGLSGININSAKGIRQVNSEVSKSNTLKESSVKLAKQLKNAEDEEVKGKIRLAEATRLQKKELKEAIQLEKAEAGSLNKLSLTVKKYETELRKLNLTTVAGRKRQTELISKIDQSNAAFKRNSSALSRQRIGIGKYSTALKGAGASLKSFSGALGLTSGVFILAQGLKDAVKLFADFEQGNANLASILGTTKEAINVLTSDAKRLGSVTSFTASQITELQTELAKLGFSEKEILEATDAIQQLAAATGTELAEAAAVAGATLGGFGLEAEQTQRIADVMAKSFSTSALDMDKFKESMKSAAPAAKAVGISVEETTALLGTLANAGISGSKAGNNLKASFINLNDAGLTLDEGLLKVANSQDKLGTASALVGKNAAASFLVLAEGVETTERLKLGFENSGGAAQKMADTQLDTLSGSVTLLSSAYEGFILSLEDGDGEIGKWVRSTVEATTTILQLLSGIEQTDEAIENIRFGETIVKIKNFTDTWGDAFVSIDNFKDALKDTVDILTTIVTFGIIENVSDDFLGLADATEKYGAAQREEIRISAIAQKAIKSLSKSVREAVFAEQERIQALVDGNITQEERVELIKSLNAEYPELLGNYDLENLSQEDAIEIQKEIRKQLIETAIVERKILALKFADRKIAEEQAKIAKITNAEVREQRLKELAFEEKRQLGRINAVEEETRRRLGLADDIDESNDNSLENAIENDDKRLESFKSTSEKIIDHAEIEEKRLHDLRTQQLDDVKSNDKANEKIAEDRAKAEADRLKDINDSQEKSAEQDVKNRAEAEAQRQKQLKDNLNTTVDIFKIATDAIANNLDAEIENGRDKIRESQSAIDTLKQQAVLGNADAKESIKAEKLKIANEKERIESLEKKKRDLLIVVAGLELLSQKINSGDPNATSSASSELSGFISGLSGFYEGTSTTLGADLGNAYAIKGDRDTHIIKAHKDEHIIGVKNSRRLGGMSQDDIVEGALMLKNGEFTNQRVIRSMNATTQLDDSRMVSAMNEVKQAIDRIDIPEHHFNWNELNKMAIHTIKSKGKVVRNHNRMQ